MTAVVGILNKRGIAIAADSAVTRSHGWNEKVTKNGNKMIRLSNAVPISVMITGNADFLCNPWEVIIRRYRQERGHILHPTVEACAHDLFDYIAKFDLLWDDKVINAMIRRILERIFESICREIPYDLKRKKDDKLVRHKQYTNAFKKLLKKERERELKLGICPQFVGYTIDRFREFAKEIIDEFVDEKTGMPFDTFPKDVMENLREELELSLLTRLSTRVEYEELLHISDYATLIFCGYGSEQEYPSLVAANVWEGFDHRVNYHIKPEDNICISDEKPVAICPYAQVDVSKSIIRGQYCEWSTLVYNNLDEALNPFSTTIFFDEEEGLDMEFLNILQEVNYADIIEKHRKRFLRQLDKNQHEWEKTLLNYDMKAMAALAESMIDLTGFQRILTFQQEGVGGDVDVAVITKNDGFSWIRRKSWYRHKDVNGMYNNLGI